MVAINKLKKNDLKRLGFNGDVRTMKNDLRELVKRQGWKLRNDTPETLRRKVGAIRLIRQVVRQRKIQNNIIASRARRTRRNAVSRKLRMERGLPEWLMKVNMRVLISQEEKWITRIYRLRSATNNLDVFRQSITDYPEIGWGQGDYADIEVLQIDFAGEPRLVDNTDHADIHMRADSEGFCVIRTILKRMATVDGYKSYTFEKIEQQFKDLFNYTRGRGVTANQLKEWIIHYNIRANMYALKPNGDMCLQYLYNGPSHHALVIIPFIINNDHIYLIEDVGIINVLKSGHCKSINELLFGAVKNTASNAELFLNYQLTTLKDLTFEGEEFNGIIYVEGCTFAELMTKLKSNVKQDCLCIDYQRETVINPINGNVLCVV